MDNLINSITSTSYSGITLTLSMAIVAMAAALIFGLVISLTYMGTHKNKYQQSFAITLYNVADNFDGYNFVCGSNVARAFSLAGTLSIIRFRSAPGDPGGYRIYFFDIAAGLACGVGLYGYGALFVLLLLPVYDCDFKIKFGKPNTTAKNLKITIPENLDYEGIFDEIIKKYSKIIHYKRSESTDLGSLYELTYSVNMNKDADEKEVY